ncbi:MAG: Cob(I)yrinic acid a,c-diamide adenosyltransferase [Promethearchaeota archaeon]|nr:MAG: Cob(I)yrinic acid a,c-diamide adenosyltransferase [Candidatus Lokiarchaeota archaeon]
MNIKKQRQLHSREDDGIFSNTTALEKGLTHYYFGDGKGKTTALIGLLIRALGHNLKPLLIQFLKRHTIDNTKNGFFMGEINFLKSHMEIKQFGSGKFVTPDTAKQKQEIASARLGLEFAATQIMSEKYDVVALDEVVNAISMNLISIDDLVKTIKNKPDHVEIICTGMLKYKKLVDIADYVVGFNCINHPYKKGILARKGIEY